MDYTIFYKQKFESIDSKTIADIADYDFFISAYNESERVKSVFEDISSPVKHWIIFPEYEFNALELTHLKGEIFNYTDFDEEDKYDESKIILDYYLKNEELFKQKKVAIDITGFLRPHLVYMIRLFKEINIDGIDIIYSEPNNYVKKENTRFSEEYTNIREINGCMNSHNPETYNDILILGSGYDYQLISKIAKFKAETKKVQVLGFPSLQADMFQENILKAYQAEEEVSSGEFALDSDEVILAPANDPFVTAQCISDFVEKERKKKEITNIYLCPLATKAQTLGIALYFIYECMDKPISVIFPFSKKYSRETSEGIARIWVYTVEF